MLDWFEFSVSVQTVLIGLGTGTGLFSLHQFFSGGKDLELADAMEETPTSAVRDVTPNGYFEVKGRAFSQHPLHVSRVAEELIFYRYVHREEWDYRDREGHSYKEESVLQVNEESAPFTVGDATGNIEVDPRGARLEGRLLDRFTQTQADSGPSFADRAMGETGRKRNHKVIFETFGATSGSEIYVLGPTAPGATEPAMFRQNSSESRPFVVSARSEEELGERLSEVGWVRTMVSGMVFLFALGCGAGLAYLPPETLAAEATINYESLQSIKTFLHFLWPW